MKMRMRMMQEACKLITLGSLLSLCAQACLTRVRTIEKREPFAFERSERPQMTQQTRPILSQSIKAQQKPGQDLFAKRKKLRIEPLSEARETGSLTLLQNPSNNLFSNLNQVEVGDFVEVRIVQKGKDEAKTKIKTPDVGKPGKASAGEDQAAESTAPSLDEDKLLEALPGLEPADKGQSVLKEVKMQVVHRFANGDVLLAYQRQSEGEGKVHAIEVRARLQAEKLLARSEVTTEDLSDVAIQDSFNGELVEKASTSWEDEYSLRLSGFSEVTSKVAAQLEEKRQGLEKLRNQMQKRLQVMGSERRQWAKERDSFVQEQQRQKETLEQFKQKLGEQATKIQEQDELLKEQSQQLESFHSIEGDAAKQGGGKVSSDVKPRKS